jgi:hypothetical protein
MNTFTKEGKSVLNYKELNSEAATEALNGSMRSNRSQERLSPM